MSNEWSFDQKHPAYESKAPSNRAWALVKSVLLRANVDPSVEISSPSSIHDLQPA